MARLRASWRTSLPVVQQPRNPQSESIARNPYQTAVHQLIHMGSALPVAWRVSYGRRGRPQAEGRAFSPAPSGLLAPASLQKSPPVRLPRLARARTGAGVPCAAHHGTPSQQGAAPTMESAMKNIAEFTIIGRVGAIKTLGKAVRVTIASNYRLKDERSEWREDTYWNEVTVFSPTTQAYIAEHIAKGDLVHMRGRLRQSSYERNGGRVYTVDLVASSFSRLAQAQLEQ